MATPVRLPDLGQTIEPVRLAAAFKSVGDAVVAGEPLAEVETDKATMEFDSPADGVLLAWQIEVGDEIAPEAVLAWIGQPGEAVPPEPPPLAAAVEARPLNPNQRAISRRVSLSHATIVPVNITGKVRMRPAIALRQRLLEAGTRMTFDAIFIHAVSRIIRQFPQFLCHLVGHEVRPGPGVDIAFAAAVKDELYTPVIHQADQKGLEQIQQELEALALKARHRKLTLLDLSQASFTISNLGMLPIHTFNIIVPPGQSASMSIGGMEEELVLENAQVRAEPIAWVVVSIDHRLVNGRRGAEFLAKLKQFMEALE